MDLDFLKLLMDKTGFPEEASRMFLTGIRRKRALWWSMMSTDQPA